MFKTKLEIQKWLDEMEVKNYTINNDLTIDVNDDVSFIVNYYLNFQFNLELLMVTLQFGIVN
jgi:hypothetical protein